MTTLATVEVRLAIPALLLASEIAAREATRGVRAAGRAVALAVRPRLRIVSPIGLGLLLFLLAACAAYP